jgi:hypothetical protein
MTSTWMDGHHLEGRLFVPRDVIKSQCVPPRRRKAAVAADERGYAANSPLGLPSRTIFRQYA